MLNFPQSSAPAFRFRRARASFQALDTDELSFEAGDIVEILWEWQEIAVEGWLWGRLVFGEAGWPWNTSWGAHPFGLVPAFLLAAQASPEASPERSLCTAAAAHLQKVWVGWKIKRCRGRRVEVWPWDSALQQEILAPLAWLRAEKKRVALMRAEKARVRVEERRAATRSLNEDSKDEQELYRRVLGELDEEDLDYKNIRELIQASSLSCSLKWTPEEAAFARASRARRARPWAPVTTSKRPPPLPPLTPPLPLPSPSVEVLKECVCPITAEIMTDPVCTSDGFTYERTAITEWLRTKDTSPSTGALLESKKLIPNFLARSIIRRL